MIPGLEFSEHVPMDQRQFRRENSTGIPWKVALVVLLLFASSHALATTQSTGASQQKKSANHLAAAERLVADGDRLRAEWKKESLQLAVRKYTEAKLYFRSTNSAGRETEVLKRLGDVQTTLSDFQSAIETYNHLLDLGRRLSDQRTEVDALNRLANAYLETADSTKAFPYCMEAYELAQQIGYLQGTVQALNHLGVTSSISSDVAKAQDSFDAATKLLPPGQRDDLFGQTMLNLGYLHSNLGNMQLALDCYIQALTLWQATRDYQRRALTLTAMAGIYTQQGERQKALELHQEALNLFRAMGSRNGEAATLNGLGYFYDDLGDRDRALACYSKALDLYESIGNRNYAAITMGYLGRVHFALGDKVKALDFYEKKLATSRSAQDRRMEAYTLRDIGNVLITTNDLNQALANYKQAQTLSQSVLDRRGEAHILIGIGSLLSKLGRLPEALTKYQQALPLMQSVADRRGEVNAWYGIARSQRDLGHLSESRKAIESSIELIEKLRTKTASSSLRISYLETVYEHYEFYTDLLMRFHQQDPSAGFEKMALEANDRARARTLLENLINGGTQIRHAVDPGLLAEETKARKLLNQKAEQQMRLLSSKYTTEKAIIVQKELETLLARYEDLEAKVRDGSPRYAALTQPPVVKLADIQKEIDQETLLIEYSLGTERSYGWAVTNSSVSTFELPGRAQLEAAAKEVYALLTIERGRKKGESLLAQRQRIAKAEGEYPAVAAKLSSILITPITAQLNRKRLVIVADGLLQYIPFGALPDPAAAGPTVENRPPLIVSHEVVSIPSLSTLKALRTEERSRQTPGKALFILADPVFEATDPRLRQAKVSRSDQRNTPLERAPEQLGSAEYPLLFERLPFTLQEANAISVVVPETQSKRALSFQASLATAMDPDLRHYRIVHFATHGLLNNAHPELSGIVLSLFDKNGKRQDGFLRLNEIYNLDLHADLVVLSACQTALGKEARGEGLIGLTRGFMYAGAPRVVASLWRINDRSTAELMRFFYEGMFEQKLSPSAALREAQIKMWQSKEWRFPHYWAAFVIHGEWN
jgi:CHAT domain-containing protein/Flp pilus assembly protein TadD